MCTLWKVKNWKDTPPTLRKTRNSRGCSTPASLGPQLPSSPLRHCDLFDWLPCHERIYIHDLQAIIPYGVHWKHARTSHSSCHCTLKHNVNALLRHRVPSQFSIDRFIFNRSVCSWCHHLSSFISHTLLIINNQFIIKCTALCASLVFSTVQRIM